MTKIPVTYQCWGCGSEIVVFEDVDAPIPSLVKWNLCPECIKAKEQKDNGKAIIHR